MNPFRPLYDLCNSPKGELIDFPRMIDVELTSSCNFRCLMCPTGNRSLDRHAEFMTEETYEKIVDQCAEHGTALRFIGWGEPTLHPRVMGFVGAAFSRGLLTHLNTNGSKITGNMSRGLVGMGLDSIKFSFQGVNRQSYLDMRRTDFFGGMIEAIGLMRWARVSQTPWIAASTSITDETPEQVEKFRQIMTPLVDELTIGNTTFDFMDLSAVRLRPGEKAMLEKAMAAESVEKRHPDPCPEVWDKLSIHADGTGVVCCNDFDAVTNLGNINDTTIAEMWRHHEIEAYRERLVRKEYSGPLCESCFDYMNCTKKEVAM